MNNLSFPEGWNKKEVLFAEIHWHKCAIREPQQKDVYLVTISNPGIANTVIPAEWTGDMWSCENIGNVVAWAYFPAPYEEAK